MTEDYYKEELKELWHEVFGDTKEYIDDFFESNFVSENTLIHIAEGKPAAALYMIPYELKGMMQTEKLYYLYALATKEAYRKQGIMGGLIRQAEQIAMEQKAFAVFLLPASRSLFGYYEKFGFETSGTITELIMQDTEIAAYLSNTRNMLKSNIQLIPATDTQIWEHYIKGPFYRQGCVLLSYEQHVFYLTQLQKMGGKQMLYHSNDGVHGYLLYLLSPESHVLTIYESDITINMFPNLMNALNEAESFQKFIFYQPFGCIPADRLITPFMNTRPFAMMRKLSGPKSPEAGLLVNKVLK